LPPRPQAIFGRITGKQEGCEKHISDCKTEVECEARNMKTLRSGGNLFIKYPSVAHSLPSNKQRALICIIRASHYKSYMYTCGTERLVEWQTVPSMCVCVCGCLSECVVVRLDHMIHTSIVECTSRTRKSTVFRGNKKTQNATRRVNCLSDASCVWFNG